MGVSRLDSTDVSLFNEGRHFRLYEKLGAHPMTVGGVSGVLFAVWAPNAERVAVVGDFNDWNGTRHPLSPHGDSGVWEGFLPGATAGMRYKYRLLSRLGGGEFDKADPFAFANEGPPKTASVVFEPDHEWLDAEWMRSRERLQRLDKPISIYEVHLGSWRRVPEEDGRFLSYEELAPRLIDHVQHHGFTHVEILPVMEHPFYGSWGYQTTGYFAPSARYGTPNDFAAFVDTFHQAGIGVILDWVPSHFPSDAFALASFDGTHLYEHADIRQRAHGDHPDQRQQRHDLVSGLLEGGHDDVDGHPNGGDDGSDARHEREYCVLGGHGDEAGLHDGAEHRDGGDRLQRDRAVAGCQRQSGEPRERDHDYSE